MSGTTVNRRRSTRIQRASSNRNGSYSQSQSQRAVNNNNHSNRSSSNNNRYSGNKRSKPEESSDDDSSDESSEESDESDYETSLSTSNNNSSLSTPFSSNSSLQRHRNHNNYNNHNNRGHNRRYHHSQSSQLTELAASQSQVQAQHAKRRRMQYQVQTEKWKQNQSNIQRRSTRLRYRKLADDTHDNRAAIVDPMSNQFMDKLEEQNKIYEDVCHPNEAFMDIEQAKNMTNILKEQTRTLANEQFTITPQDYISAIIREFGANNRSSQQSQIQDDDTPAQVNWAAIGQRFAPWFLTVPSIQFMNGPLQNCESVPEVQKKPRQVRQKKTFTTDAPMIQPKKVVKQKKADKTETKSRVTHLRKILRRKCEDQDGVNPFEFLINPHSYSQTVENLFDMSFIMKEGYAQMDVNNTTEQPVLSYVSASERTRRHDLNMINKKATRTNGQCIVKINPATFCNLIDVYDIQQSQIERADANMSSEDDDSEENSDDEKSMSTDEGSEEESEPEMHRRRRGLGKSRRGRGNKRANGHSNNGRGRNVRNGRRRNNDKEEAD